MVLEAWAKNKCNGLNVYDNIARDYTSIELFDLLYNNDNMNEPPLKPLIIVSRAIRS